MQLARVITQTVTAGEYCIRLYYHMFGDNVRKLRLMSRVGGVDTLLEELEGNQGNEWHRYTKSFNYLNLQNFLQKRMVVTLNFEFDSDHELLSL